MMKTLFTIDYYEHPNFLNDDEINKLIGSINKQDLYKILLFSNITLNKEEAVNNRNM